MLGHAFDRSDLALLTACRQHGAGQHGHAVNLYSTGATGGIITATLGSGKLQLLAQAVEQQLAGFDRNLMRAAIDAKLYELFGHEDSYELLASSCCDFIIAFKANCTAKSLLIPAPGLVHALVHQ